MDQLTEFILGHLCQMLETPAGPGVVAGLVDRNGRVMGLVDAGERMPGDVVVLRAVDQSGLNMEAAVKIAREA